MRCRNTSAALALFGLFYTALVVRLLATAGSAFTPHAPPTRIGSGDDDDATPYQEDAAAKLSAQTPSLLRSTRPKLRFTQAWSTGHVGTRFLASLFAASVIHAPPSDGAAAGEHAVFWTERAITLSPLDETAEEDDVPDTPRLLQCYMAGRFGTDDFTVTDLSRTDRARAWRQSNEWYGPDLKQWNEEGRTDLIRDYVENERVPALRRVFDHFAPHLSHMVKFGHTAIFYDLVSYYEAMSGAFEFDLVRIQRRRVLIAKSFAREDDRNNRLQKVRPKKYMKKRGPCYFRHSPRGIVTCPWYETSTLRPSRPLWFRWTGFQQYLWFVDEVEIRFQLFLAKYPDSSVHYLSFDDSDTINATSVEQLASFLGVQSPVEYVDRIDHQSHTTTRGKRRRARLDDKLLDEAEAYAREAPWCVQNSLESTFSVDCDVLA